MNERTCYNCSDPIPPETEHFIIDNYGYCANCVEVTPYTAYMYYVDGEYMGSSEEDTVKHVESFDDEYEGEEEEA